MALVLLYLQERVSALMHKYPEIQELAKTSDLAKLELEEQRRIGG